MRYRLISKILTTVFLCTTATLGLVTTAAAAVSPAPTAPSAKIDYVALDSGVLINAKRDTGYLKKLDGALGKRRPCIVPQVYKEFGGTREERAWLNKFLKQRTGKKSTTYQSKIVFDTLRERARVTGQSMERADTLVVAQAKMLGLVLITADARLANNLEAINRRYRNAYPVERLPAAAAFTRNSVMAATTICK